MTGKEELKPGDRIICRSNEGYNTMGSITTIYGVSDMSINTNGSVTGWVRKHDFRWGCYGFHSRPKVLPKDVIRFNEKQDKVMSHNKKLLQEVAQRLSTEL